MDDIIHIVKKNWYNSRLIVILATSVQIAFFGVLLSEMVGMPIPVVRQIVGFIYLTFMPGLGILFIIKPNGLRLSEFIVFTIGISITSIMLLGLAAVVLYPLFGIARPLDFGSISITISLVVVILFMIGITDKRKNFWKINFPCIKDYNSLLAPSVLILPLVAILVTQLSSSGGNNWLLLLLIVIIGSIPIIITIGNVIPKMFYPLVIYSIALTLLYSTSIMWDHLVEWGDVFYEYRLSNIALTDGIWHFNEYGNLNSATSLTILAPIYSTILDLDLIWVFKLIYPFFFALVPTAIYLVVCSVTKSSSRAFLASFFYVSIFPFFTVMLGANRQQIAEILLILLVYTFFCTKMQKSARSVLILIFSFGIIISHYMIAELILLTLFISIFVQYIINSKIILKVVSAIYPDDKSEERDCMGFHCDFTWTNGKKRKNLCIPLSFIVVYIVLLLAWSMLVTGSSSINGMVEITSMISKNVITDFLDPTVTQGLGTIASSSSTPLNLMNKLLHVVTQVFIVVGILVTIIYVQRDINETRYLIIGLPFLGLLVASLFIPYFAATINLSRMYQISTIFLSPYCVIGGLYSLKLLLKHVNMDLSLKQCLKTLSIIFVIFFLFNIGFFQTLAGETTKLTPDKYLDSRPHFYQSEIFASNWVKEHGAVDCKLYCDTFNSYLFVLNDYPISYLDENTVSNRLSKEAYIYLGRKNVFNGIFKIAPSSSSLNQIRLYSVDKSSNELSLFTNPTQFNQIYFNQDAKLFFT